MASPTQKHELFERVHAYDWGSTPLGPMRSWPERLRSLVDLMLDAPQPTLIAWGTTLTTIYNDAYAPILGTKHPDALGRPYAELFAETWHEHHPMVEATLRGEGQYVVDRPVQLLGRDDPLSWFTFSWTPLRGVDAAVVGFHCVATETTARINAEQHLRTSEERHRLLLALTDRLQAVADAAHIEEIVAQMLGEHLGADRVFYGLISADGETSSIRGDYHTNRVASIAGDHPVAAFGPPLMATMRAGGTLVIRDVMTEPSLDEQERSAYTSRAVGAAIGKGIVKGDRWVAVLGVHQRTARRWTQGEVALVEEIAIRAWTAIEHARAEAALRERDARFKALVTASSEVLYSMSPDWTEMRQLNSQGFLTITPAPSSSWVERYLPPAAQAEVLKAIEQAVREKSVFQLEHQVLTADGTVGWVLSRAIPLLDSGGTLVEWFGAAHDVTARRQAEQALRNALAERETLLKELHHRVKNNLAVIDSMLQLQADTFPDPRVRSALEESSNRIHAIAEIHRVLYGSSDLASVDLRTYVEALALSLSEALSFDRHRVSVVVDAQPLRMDLAGAVPIGIILNELITNAMKHAFPGNRTGTITVKTNKLKDLIELHVFDDGIGLPQPMPNTSLGLKLVRILSAQLRGSVEFQSSGGTSIIVRFPEKSLGLAQAEGDSNSNKNSKVASHLAGEA